MNLKTIILKVKGDWEEVVNDCRATVKKDDLGHYPSFKFQRDIMIAEHDPIRDIEIKFTWKNIPYWIAMHWKTHIWRSRTNTQRNDRQKEYDRNGARQDALVNFVGDPNAQHCIDTWRKRLCYQAAMETREYAEDFKFSIMGDDRLAAVGYSLVPNCIYRCGCPEINKCSRFKNLCLKDPRCKSSDIVERYDAYNNIFMKEFESKHEKDCNIKRE